MAALFFRIYQPKLYILPPEFPSVFRNSPLLQPGSPDLWRLRRRCQHRRHRWPSGHAGGAQAGGSS